MEFNHFVSIRGQHLKEFRCSTAGDMRGGYNTVTVKKQDDTHAHITFEKADTHCQDPEISEYLADISVLNELENVIRKEKMNFWNRKKFTDMFVADGANTSYSFRFDKAHVDFSSQIYPQKYREKLNSFNDIISNSVANAEKLSCKAGLSD